MLITNSGELEKYCRRFTEAEFVTVDTEFLRERTYWPQLCLVQVADREQAVAIDVLAPGLDLGPLYRLMREPDVLKVFHSCDQDMAVFHYVMGDVPAPVFDTQIAAMVCGFGEQPGYAALVSSMTGHSIDKASQMTDWSRRPLTDRQIDYAIGDVTYLIPVYDELRERLRTNGRRDWVAEELARVGLASNYENDPLQQWRRVRIRRPTRKTLAVLREVAAWRERVAQQRDLPRGWVLKDESVAEISATHPSTTGQLERVRGVSRRLAEGRDGAAVLDAVRRALASPSETWPDVPRRRKPESEGADTLVALLQALLRIRSEEHEVAPALIANRRDLELIAGDDDAEVPALSGWRRKLYGDEALKLKHGEISLRGDGNRAVVVGDGR